MYNEYIMQCKITQLFANRQWGVTCMEKVNKVNRSMHMIHDSA